MGWDTYARSKMPLKLVLTIIIAVAVNFGLVVGFQALVTYRFDSPVDDITVLGKMDAAYKDCTMIDITFADPNFYSGHSDFPEIVFLIETHSGDMELVTVARHFLFDRYRIVKSACKELDVGADQIRLRSGTTFLYVEVAENESTGLPDIRINSLSGTSGKYDSVMIISIAVLCVVEFIAYCLLFKRHELL